MTASLRSIILSIISVGFLAGCAAEKYMPKPFIPARVDTSGYVPKVDTFVVLLDASSSMNFEAAGRPNFTTAKEVVAAMNQTIPPLGYKAALLGFGTGSCLGGPATVVYGPATYQSAAFADGLAKISCAGGTTPMSAGVDAAGNLPKAASDKAALILVSDFWQVDAAAVSSAVSKLKADYGNRLCIHTIRVGDAGEGNELIAALAGVSSCGLAREAASLESPAAMAKYVTDVLLTPAATKYEKNTIAASALFDHDKSVIKSEGQKALHNLDESIKAKKANVTEIHVVGHTDSTGSEEHNMGLSKRRAEAVRGYMVSDGIAASMIKVSGEGETNPVASNATSEGRAENRRVDIYVGTNQPAD